MKELVIEDLLRFNILGLKQICSNNRDFFLVSIHRHE